MTRQKVMSIRVTDAEFDALKAAATEFRRRTGELVTPSDLLRWGAAAFTEQAGVAFPSTAVGNE
jgi:hypothetical protein